MREAVTQFEPEEARNAMEAREVDRMLAQATKLRAKADIDLAEGQTSPSRAHVATAATRVAMVDVQ